MLGYGVFAKENIEKGSFLLEYCGCLLDADDGGKLEDQTYVFFFSYQSKRLWHVF
jgi:SET domain-containing protein